MALGRSSVAVICAVCPTSFYPWKRKRVGPPTCSIKCARALTGRAQAGKPLTHALAGRQLQTQARAAAALCARFGIDLTPREIAIFRYGVQTGYDAGYRQRRREAA